MCMSEHIPTQMKLSSQKHVISLIAREVCFLVLGNHAFMKCTCRNAFKRSSMNWKDVNLEGKGRNQ